LNEREFEMALDPEANSRWQMDAAFILREKKIGLWRLPAIVYQNQSSGADANLLFDDLIYFCSEGGNGRRLPWRIEALG